MGVFYLDLPSENEETWFYGVNNESIHDTKNFNLISILEKSLYEDPIQGQSSWKTAEYDKG